MPRNKVQFQKGFSLTAFNNQYGTEQKCREKLFKARWPKGYTCPKCGHHAYYMVLSRLLYQCAQCRHQASLTSGTLFASSKLSLTTWFFAIFMVTQSKEGISALNLRRLLGISVNAALRMKHKLQHVMKNADDRRILHGFIELDDAYWGGKRKGGKRGRGAPGKTPVLAAVSRNEKGHPIHMRLSKVSSFTTSIIKRWSLSHLDRDCVVLTDCFHPFAAIDDTVAVHGSIKSSDLYDNPDNKVFRWVNTIIGNVKRALHGTYHSVSSKHLPRYLAEFSFRFNNRFHMELMVPYLIQHAAAAIPIPQRLLKLAEDEG